MGRAKGTRDEGRHLPHPQGRPVAGRIAAWSRGSRGVVEGELRRNPKDEARNHVSSPPRRRGTKRRSPLSARAPPFGRTTPLGHANASIVGIGSPKAIGDITKGLTTTAAVFVVFSANMRGERREGKDAPTKTHKAPEKIEA